MASLPGESVPHSAAASGRPEASSTRESPAEPGEQRAERYGLVTLTRHVKRDGRALILYTRDEPDGHG